MSGACSGLLRVCVSARHGACAWGNKGGLRVLREEEDPSGHDLERGRELDT